MIDCCNFQYNHRINSKYGPKGKYKMNRLHDRVVFFASVVSSSQEPRYSWVDWLRALSEHVKTKQAESCINKIPDKQTLRTLNPNSWKMENNKNIRALSPSIYDKKDGLSILYWIQPRFYPLYTLESSHIHVKDPFYLIRRSVKTSKSC